MDTATFEILTKDHPEILASTNKQGITPLFLALSNPAVDYDAVYALVSEDAAKMSDPLGLLVRRTGQLRKFVFQTLLTPSHFSLVSLYIMLV